MNREDLDQVCDAGTSEALKEMLETVLRALAGLNSRDARRVLRFANNAVDELAVVSLMEKTEASDQNDRLVMTEEAFVEAVRGRKSKEPNEGSNALADRVAALERSLLYGSAYGLAFTKYKLSQPESFQL